MATKNAMSLYSEKERVLSQPAFILHHRPYRNTSLLLDVLSKDHGRLSLIAKGAKRPKSALRACLQSFQHLSLSWVRKTGLGTLTQAEFRERPRFLEGDAMYAALYVNELLTRALEKDHPEIDIYDAYVQVLNALTELGVGQALRVFEYDLLQSLGFEIQLDFDVEQNPISENLFYKFIPESGFVESKEKNVFLFSGKHLLAFSEKNFRSPEVLKTAQQLMQIGLQGIIGKEPLKTRELFVAYRQMQKIT